MTDSRAKQAADEAPFLGMDGHGNSAPSGVSERQKRISNRQRLFSAKNFLPERVGAQILKHWDIDRNHIGQGGYGKVFVAQDRFHPEIQVAIKKIPVFDEEKRQAFKQEVAVMKALDHPNICKLLETYEEERFYFFVMELCDGGEVFERIMEHGMIGERGTADIVRQCASALKYAHRCGIAHRDIKPENICYATNDPDSNFIKVIDWGLGFYFGEARMCSAVGSLTYAAPEVLEARKDVGYDNMCDIWSLGVICYVMLCGKPPFWGQYNEQLKRMKKEVFPMCDKTWEGISDHAKGLIKAMLKAKPSQRCSLDYVLEHPWLKEDRCTNINPKIAKQVLRNLRSFSNTKEFVQVCVAGVARQLDQKSAMNVYQVFCQLDRDVDGVLTLEEVKEGFRSLCNAGDDELKEIEEMFSKLDLSGSGNIDYTEFVAAGMGARLSTEEHVLWAAFKAFDFDQNGTISKSEIMKVLNNCGCHDVFGNDSCDDFTEELFDRFAEPRSTSSLTSNDEFNFQEFAAMMRDCAGKRAETDRAITDRAITEATGGERAISFHDNYKALADLRPAPRVRHGNNGFLRTISGVLGRRALAVCKLG